MGDELSLFEQILFEAPGDDPPDIPAGGAGPPDMPDEPAAPDDTGGPPDIADDAGGDAPVEDDGGGDGGDPEAPPEMGGGDGDGSFDGGDEFGDTGDDQGDGEQQDLGLDDKVSSIMNMQLYQRFLSLLNNVGSELSMCKINNDILYTLSPKCMEIVPALKKLDENIRIYLKNSFIHENYSKNLLFFNKCLNLLKLLNDVFDGDVRKGVNALDNH